MTGSINSIAAGNAAAGVKGNSSVRKVAEGFEAIFLREIMGSMRKAHLAEDPFSSSATQNFREMADAQMAGDLAHQGTFGLAQLIEKQLAAQGGSK